ncbi:tyrosine-type recombinase/integrase [Dysgonomonas sp. ZJ709]|uniref:tyrosine-type recombinase/integrase n=1 Tax=Dysgonomonas sp. ZJ709 TaxID=2709797 RepID=UPI0013ECB750|nr:tyrosine-type recombinase/integrase [Dysgonomonas sp. ZJ709]
MYTVNFKGKPHPKQKGLVKIDMIFFKTGYARVSKVINITGLYKDWDKTTQNFTTNTSENLSKNTQLSDLRRKFVKVAEDWEAEERNWSPVQWSHYFDKEKEKREEKKILSILQMIELIIHTKKTSQRFKNGKIVTCQSTSKTYIDIRNTLSKFTKEKYNKNFSGYFFEDITEQFLLDYIFYLRKCGSEKGNQGRVPGRLKSFCGVFYYANKKGIPGADITVFDNVRLYMKDKDREPRTIPSEIMDKIESFDSKDLSETEKFHLDMFLFCYYAGGIAPIDMAYLTWGSIQDGVLVYERMKVSKQAKMPFLNNARQIAKKYKKKCYDNHVLPIFTEKHVSDRQKSSKVERLSHEISETLGKVAKQVGYNGEIVWYSARGTFITKMVKLGYDPADIAKMAGNSVATIFKNYFKPKDASTIKKDLNKVFSKVI